MDRSFLSYQFVGTTNNLHEGRSPQHIRRISNKLGFEEKERHIIEEFLPSLRGLQSTRQMTKSMSPSSVIVNDRSNPQQLTYQPAHQSANPSPRAQSSSFSSKQQHLTWLKKRVIKLQTHQDSLVRQIQTQIYVPDELFVTTQQGATEFEDYFRQLPVQFQQQKEKLKLVQYQLAQVRQELFMMENFTDTQHTAKIKYFSSSVNSENQKIQLSDLTRELPKLRNPRGTHRRRKQTQYMKDRSRLVPKPLYQQETGEIAKDSYFVRQIQMPQFVREKHLDIILPLQSFHKGDIDQQFSDFALRNPQDEQVGKPESREERLEYVNMLMESDDEELLQPNTKQSRQKTARTERQKLNSNSYSQLQTSKLALTSHRFFKYNETYTKYLKYASIKLFHRHKRSLKLYFNAALFMIKLLLNTEKSLIIYQKIASQHHKQYFPACNEDCLQFVNLTLVKQIFCKPQRVAILQKLTHTNPNQRILQLQSSLECVHEIYERLLNGNFTYKLYKFLKCISAQSFYSLNNFHSTHVYQQLPFSKLFGYLDFNRTTDRSAADIKKLIIFEFVVIKNIIFYGLFFKVEELFRQLKVEPETLYCVVAILLYLFMPEMSPIQMVNKKFDGQYSLEHMKILMKIYNPIVQELKRQEGFNLNLEEARKLQDQWLEKVIKHIE